jgi:hypothetical protein
MIQAKGLSAYKVVATILRLDVGDADLPILPFVGQKPDERATIPIVVFSSGNSKPFLDHQQLSNRKRGLIRCIAQGIRSFLGFCLEHEERKVEGFRIRAKRVGRDGLINAFARRRTSLVGQRQNAAQPSGVS